MDMTNKIKEYVISCGMSLVGIASVDRFDDVPYGRKPTEILPGAKSVIVFGVHMLDGAVQAKFRALESGNQAAHSIYGRYARGTVPTVHLMCTTYSLCHFIERETKKTAMPTMTGPWSMGRPFSHRHAAVAAGLGEFGWSKAVLTPEYGPRIRWGAVITSLELDPDPIYSGEKLCRECMICAKKCPTQAIPVKSKENEETFVCGEKKHIHGKIDFNACRTACCALTEKTGGKIDYLKKSNPSDKDIEDAILYMGFEPGGTLRPPTWKCDLCIDYCPIGSWNERFASRGLLSK